MDKRAYGHVITKISRMDKLPNFAKHWAPLARALRVRRAPRLSTQERFANKKKQLPKQYPYSSSTTQLWLKSFLVKLRVRNL